MRKEEGAREIISKSLWLCFPLITVAAPGWRAVSYEGIPAEELNSPILDAAASGFGMGHVCSIFGRKRTR
jgi:hypothetical protein